MWNTESTKVRAEYGDKAEALKAQHKLMYPDYKYAPRRPEQVKRRAKRNAGKVVKGKTDTSKVSKPRKVPIGELGESHMRILIEEASELDSSVLRQHPINMGISSYTELQTQSDIDEWNAAIPAYDGAGFSNPFDADFLNSIQFDPFNNGNMDHSAF